MWLFPHMTKVTCLHSHNFMKNNNSINSLDIFYLAKTYVVNGECIKSINSEIDIDKKEIQNRIYNHDNIVIQNEDNIDIYCDIEFLEIFRNIIVDYFEGVRNREDAFFKAYEAGMVVVHAK